MKIIQLNIWHGKLGQIAIDFINSQQPDIVCMQEVNEIPPGPIYGMFVPLNEIQRQTGLKHVSFAPTFSYSFMNRQARFGNAILSKFPLDNEKTVFVHDQYKENFDSSQDDYNIRNLQTCQVQTSEGVLNIINHHGFHIFDPRGDKQTEAALKKVADVVRSTNNPLIFCGDLNVIPDSPAMKPLHNLGLRNLTADNNLTTTLSRIHFLDRPVACDYIFTSHDIEIIEFRAPDEMVSDHKPLVLDFSLS